MLIRDVVELFLHNRKHQMSAAPATITTYRYALKPFVEFMEGRDRLDYAAINRLDIAAFSEFVRDNLDAGRWSKSRYLLVVKCLKAMFHWIAKDEDCREDGMKSWADRMPKGGTTPRREYIPSPADLKLWQKAFKTGSNTGLRDYLMFSVLLETGMRRGEMANLKVDNVQFDQKIIYIPTGKQGARVVNMTSVLADRLKMYLKRRERSDTKSCPYLFPSQDWVEGEQNPQFVSKVFRRVKKRLGLPNLTPHTLRHAFCTYFLVNGGNLESMRSQSGHKTYSSMLHYLHLAKVGGKMQQEEMEKISPLKMLGNR